jgi:hypothetical protein
MRILKNSTALIAVIFLIASSSCRKNELKQTTSTPTSVEAAALVINSTEVINDDSYNYDSCTAEWIQFTGEALFTFHFIVNDNRVTGVYHINIQHERGVGDISGGEYLYKPAGGIVKDSFSGSLINGSFTYMVKFSVTFVAPGPGNNLVIDTPYKITINANGVITVEKGEASLTCQ